MSSIHVLIGSEISPGLLQEPRIFGQQSFRLEIDDESEDRHINIGGTTTPRTRTAERTKLALSSALVKLHPVQ